LFAAYRPFFERATVRWQPHSEAYFRRLSELGPRARITAAMTDDGDVAGFVVNFRDGHNFQAGRIGVSPRFDRKDAVYFRLLYHALEESFALSDTRRARLSLEPTGYRMKRHLGARSVPMVNLVMGVNATWRGLLGGFAGVGRRLLRHLEDRVALEQEY
ncbi:MAG: GNAT family N-acetyltransferase, partial [Deltaproteobacteria bacterium]|nr:GNAT family N-acetyltransferase [Deltaproteobacteria bacterium]